jgi:anti-repressor protein
MSNIQVFNHPEFGKVRTINEDGKLLYCGKDVATALGYLRSNDALMQHCKGTAIYRPLATAGGVQQMRFITEPDVFRLIASSRLPNAQRFEAWLFEEIAPKAVKGELISKEQVLGLFNDPDALLKIVTSWKEDRDRANALEVENEVMKPKALFADAVSASDATILIGQLAKLLKQNGIDIGQNRLFERLRQDGFLIRRKGTDFNAPTQRAMEMGLFRVKETAITHAEGHVTVSKTTKVTGKGQQYFINMFLGKQVESVGLVR